MKKLYKIKQLFFVFILIMNAFTTFSQVCNPAGNVIIFSNYDGSKETALGRLNIVVDVNIPNLKIGIVSYERVTVNISGPFAGNVTSVIYAGYNALSCNCYAGPPVPGCSVTSTVTGVPTGTVSYVIMPPSTYMDVDGYNNIICSYQCVPGSNGGCNTPGQVVSYFTNAFPGTFRSHTTQYACWNGATFSVSTTGNCCMTAPCVLPVVGTVVGTNSICAGSINTYSVAAVAGATGYNWTLPGGWVGTSTTNTISATANSAAGTISVTVNDACGTSTASVKVIAIKALPTVTATTSNSMICIGQTVLLTASTSATSYTWNTGVTTLTTSVSPTLTTVYTTSVTGSNGCVANSAVTVSVSACTGIQNSLNDLGIILYPNPNKGLFTLELGVSSQIVISNILGEIIFNETMKIGKQNIDIQNQPNGNYFLKIIQNNKQQTIKLVKQ